MTPELMNGFHSASPAHGALSIDPIRADLMQVRKGFADCAVTLATINPLSKAAISVVSAITAIDDTLSRLARIESGPMPIMFPGTRAVTKAQDNGGGDEDAASLEARFSKLTDDEKAILFIKLAPKRN